MMRYYKHIPKKECNKVHRKYTKSTKKTTKKAKEQPQGENQKKASSLTNNPTNQQIHMVINL